MPNGEDDYTSGEEGHIIVEDPDLDIVHDDEDDFDIPEIGPNTGEFETENDDDSGDDDSGDDDSGDDDSGDDEPKCPSKIVIAPKKPVCYYGKGAHPFDAEIVVKSVKEYFDKNHKCPEGCKFASGLEIIDYGRTCYRSTTGKKDMETGRVLTYSYWRTCTPEEDGTTEEDGKPGEDDDGEKGEDKNNDGEDDKDKNNDEEEDVVPLGHNPQQKKSPQEIPV